ncbi:MAG: hypothetical protein NTW14_04020 [bacterium]|nr:hypothetical protein [bacterium]
MKQSQAIFRYGLIAAMLLALGLIWSCDSFESFKSALSGDSEQGAVKTFVDAWVISGPAGTMPLLDDRASADTINLLRTWTLKSFDGAIKRHQDKIWENPETGEKYKVKKFRVSPTVDQGNSYTAVAFEILVAKDTRKVISVAPVE